MKFFKTVLPAMLLCAAQNVVAGTVTWNFSFSWPTNSTGASGESVTNCTNLPAGGTVTFVEGFSPMSIASVNTANINYCGQNYSESDLFVNESFVTTHGSNVFTNTDALGFTIAFPNVSVAINGYAAEIYATALNGRNFWATLDLASTFTRVGPIPTGTIPTPASAALLGAGLFAFALRRKSK
jgi:hypothetical protein